jgi:hypothetical protein
VKPSCCQEQKRASFIPDRAACFQTDRHITYAERTMTLNKDFWNKSFAGTIMTRPICRRCHLQRLYVLDAHCEHASHFVAA